jgi:hypothetical protein
MAAAMIIVTIFFVIWQVSLFWRTDSLNDLPKLVIS